MKKWLEVNRDKCELEGPYECPDCGGHIMIDATYLDQMTLEVNCPYCAVELFVDEV